MKRSDANRLLDEMTDLVNEIRHAVNYPDARRRELALRALIDRAQMLLRTPHQTIDLAEERTRR